MESVENKNVLQEDTYISVWHAHLHLTPWLGSWSPRCSICGPKVENLPPFATKVGPPIHLPWSSFIWVSPGLTFNYFADSPPSLLCHYAHAKQQKPPLRRWFPWPREELRCKQNGRTQNGSLKYWKILKVHSPWGNPWGTLVYFASSSENLMPQCTFRRIKWRKMKRPIECQLFQGGGNGCNFSLTVSKMSKAQVSAAYSKNDPNPNDEVKGINKSQLPKYGFIFYPWLVLFESNTIY